MLPILKRVVDMFPKLCCSLSSHINKLSATDKDWKYSFFCFFDFIIMIIIMDWGVNNNDVL